jgi:hypothetical protein
MSEIDIGNIELARKWASRCEELNGEIANGWKKENFLLSATHIALGLGDIATAERLFLPYESIFLSVPTSLARSSALATAIRLRIAQGIKRENLIPLVEAMEELYIQFRTMGMYDYGAFSLYLGMTYVGRTMDAWSLLHDYITLFRRDRSSYSAEICKVLQNSDYMVKPV